MVQREREREGGAGYHGVMRGIYNQLSDERLA